MLRIQRIHPLAVLPRRATEDAAGYDLTTIQSCDIGPGETAILSTGLAMAVPDGTYGRIAPRSGLAAKYSIGVGAGVVDRGYRGEVKVVLFNHGKEVVHIVTGDRIAQLVLEKIKCPGVVECESLETTERGAGGFGSTGR